jgi:SHS2 domain-containing protein
MSYRYLDDETTVADAAFEARGASLEELFRESWNATLGLMIENAEALEAREHPEIELSDRSAEMLLFSFLGELLYLKDANGGLYKLDELAVHRSERAGAWKLQARAAGEAIDRRRHRLGVDIKAVTLYAFSLWEEDDGWAARVVLDT